MRPRKWENLGICYLPPGASEDTFAEVGQSPRGVGGRVRAARGGLRPPLAAPRGTENSPAGCFLSGAVENTENTQNH